MPAQNPVNIVYPIDGATYPRMDPPGAGVQWAYVTASFGTTCRDGERRVRWGFDGFQTGEARFFDEFSAQFTYRLPAGDHRFWVISDCADQGEQEVRFKVG